MKAQRINAHKLIISMLVVAPLLILFSLASGSSNVSAMQLIQAMVSPNDLSVTEHLILFDIRLPRIILALLIGGCLAICGVVAQGLFKNPLAAPSLIGVSSGASLGASLMIVAGSIFSYGFIQLSTVAIGAFIGGLLATLLVYKISSNRILGTSVTTMLLVGIAVSALAAAANQFLEYIADYEMLRRMSLWRMGGLDDANWDNVILACFAIVIALIIFIPHANALNAMLLGHSEARHLGYDVERISRILIFGIALVVGIAVALCGLIGFIGLIVPHIFRQMIGPNHQPLMIASSIGGGLLLLVADWLARTLIMPSEIPVGVITAFIGAPFFIYLIRSQMSKL